VLKIKTTYDSVTMAERRQRILYEVRKLVNEEGLEGFSMREISKRANVAPKTLYNAFGDRDRLIGCAIREVYDAVRQNVQFRTSDRTLEGLLDRAIVLNRGNLKARNYAQAVATIYFSPSTNPYLRSLLQEMAVGNTREWLEDVRAKGGLHDWVNIDHLTRHMANMEYGLILEWATSSVKDSDYLFHFVEIILFSALAATRGEVRETANSILTKMVATGELPKFENPIIRPIDVPK